MSIKSDWKSEDKSEPICHKINPGVNFTNFLPASHRSQNHKKTLMTWLSFCSLLESSLVKAVCKHVGEINPGSLGLLGEKWYRWLLLTEKNPYFFKLWRCYISPTLNFVEVLDVPRKACCHILFKVKYSAMLCIFELLTVQWFMQGT